MASVLSSVADLQEQLGNIPTDRICRAPSPGTATEADLIALMDRREGIYELVDGVIVKKAMGYYESVIAAEILHLLKMFLDKHDLGKASAPDGMMRILPGKVRYPDVGFVSWMRLPNRKLPRAKVPALVPDLAIEVLSEGNSPAEMTRKIREYFSAGVRLVWLIDPETETAQAYSAIDQVEDVPANGVLDGAEVLPGFTLSLIELFERVGEREDEAT